MSRIEALRESLHSKKNTFTWRTKIADVDVVPKVAIYARVSSVKQSNEQTIDVQLATCQKLFDKHYSDLGPMCLVGTFTDQAYNLEVYDESRQFWQMLELIKQGKINRLILPNENRVFRSASGKLRGLISDTFREARVILITPEGENSFKPTQTIDRIKTAVTQELGTINKIEVVRTLQNARRTRLVEEKQFRPAVHPYGFRIEVIRESGKRKQVKYSIYEEEAEIVRDVFNLYLGAPTKSIPAPMDRTPMGARRIADYLNRLGFNKASYRESLHPGQRESVLSQFTPMGITHMLRNPAYAGKAMVYFNETSANSTYDGDAILQTIEVPAIVDEKVFRRAEGIRDHRSESVTAKFANSAQGANWLHGLVKCGTCHWPMRGLTSSKGQRYYMCPRKKVDEREHKTVRAEDLEKPIAKRLMEIFNANFSLESFFSAFSEVGEADSSQQDLQRKQHLEQQINGLQAKLDRLIDGFTEGIIPKASYVSSKREIDTKLFELSESINEVSQRLTLVANKQSKATIDLEGLQGLLEQLSQNQAYTPRLLRLIASAALKSIAMTPVNMPPLVDLPLEQLKGLYAAGRIVPKDLRGIGWSWRRISSDLGKCGRKAAIDFDLELTWITGKVESIPVK